MTAGRAEATDWDAYYRTPARLARLTRGITQRALLRAVARFAPAPSSILELGGGNSQFLCALHARFPGARLAAIDSNPMGLRLLQDRAPKGAALTTVTADLFEPCAEVAPADLVFSVALVEHFEPARTARAIAIHFAHARPGGLVIITFPTPTWLYRVTRRLAELAGAWAFPDERPLELSEVTGEVARHGDLLECRINWAVVLTQGMVVARRHATASRPGP